MRSPYREQWAAIQLHLERIDEEGLAAEIEAIAGAEVLPFVREAHKAFGDAMGLGDDSVDARETDALRAATFALGQAIADYGRLLAGELDRHQPESVAAFRRAVAPIDQQCEATRRAGRAGASDDAEPDTDSDGELDQPMPPIEPAPPAGPGVSPGPAEA